MRDPMSENPRIIDNNEGEIVVTLEGRRVRSWDYADDTAQRSKMQEACNYVGDWIAARDELLKGKDDTINTVEQLQRHQAKVDSARQMYPPGVERPCITDNDAGEIVVALGRRTLRSWSYGQDTQRRVKMLAAREFVEGWCACKNEMLMNP